MAVVYPSRSPQEAELRLGGKEPGYVYQRDAHPNADALAERCRLLHAAEAAAITSCGMSSLSLALLATCRQGDHLLASSLMYGKTLALLTGEAARLGIESSLVDTTDLAATQAALRPQTRLLVCETISNPLMRVADLASLAELSRKAGAKLLVDNTFASPIVCRPLEWGADLVMESLTKIMNGHSDAMLGMLCGRQEAWERVDQVLTTWGFGAAPFECWLVDRGMGTLYLRVLTACRTAERLARMLQQQPAVSRVHYPGLDSNPQQLLSQSQFSTPAGPLYGHMLSFEIRGDSEQVARLMRHLPNIHFCASLGELATTLSHPASTSHRTLPREQRERQGIPDGLIRLSIGLESPEFLESELIQGLRTLDDLAVPGIR